MKNAIITGANGGIGKALVKAFAEEGYNIWACIRKENEQFENEMLKLAKEHNIWIKPVYFDLTNEEEVKSAIKEIIKTKEPIDVLVNNAGMPSTGLLGMTSVSKMREVYEVNVFSQVIIMQLVSRVMMKQKQGNIINICSVGGIEHNVGYLSYGSSKAAVIWITQSLAKELAEYNIRVNGVAPGLIDTDMGNYKPQEEIDKVLARTPMKRMGRPEEVADTVLYLASDRAKYITGDIVVVDGGRLS